MDVMMAGIKSFRKLKTGDRITDTVQTNIQNWTKQLETNPLLNGLVINVTSVASTFTLRHNLGRTPVGIIVTWCDDTFSDTPFLRIISGNSSTAEVEGNFAGQINIYIF